MADTFDPSPRSSKRRRTGVYGRDRSILATAPEITKLSDSPTIRAGSVARSSARKRAEAAEVDNIDSAYASKEDSLVAEDLAPQLAEPVPDNIMVDPAIVPVTKKMTRSTRQSRTSSDAIRNQHEQEQEQEQEKQVGHRKVKRKGKAVEIGQAAVDDTPGAAGVAVEEQADTIEVAPRSSGRERKRPRRFSIEPPEKEESSKPSRIQSAAVASPQPRGILTPSKKNKIGPRKSVLFEESEKQIEEQLGFKDIDTSTKKARKVDKSIRKSAAPVAVAKQTSDVDEIEIPETPNEPTQKPAITTVEEDDHLFDRNAPQDILQSLQLPPSSISSHQDDIEDSPELVSIKAKVLCRLTSQTLTTPAYLSSQYETLHTLLSTTVTEGESNSLLLLGARGSGKSLLLDTAVTDLSAKHSSDFHVVHLNGYFQTDDKLALREIWRQLGREMAVDETETGEVMGSYADTMASLLSLLSHSDEMDVDPNVMEVDETGKAAKSVIIVLDEFDLFTTHPRQTLLYNLFDIAQSKKAPIAVIGCSTRMDVVDCLEKRVKSRFSHRWLHVPMMKTLSMFQEAVQQMLIVEETDTERQDANRWNEHIASTFLPSPQIQTLIQQIYHTTKSLPDILIALYTPIATLVIPQPAPSAKSKSKQHSTIPVLPPPSSTTPPSLLTLVPNLPTLHLCLLMAAARLETIYSLPQINFTATHAHLTSLIQSTKLRLSSTHTGVAGAAAALRSWNKETCVSAWEDLVKWGVVAPVVKGKGDEGGEGAETRMVRVEVALEEVGWAVKGKWEGKGVGEVIGRWCKEI